MEQILTLFLLRVFKRKEKSIQQTNEWNDEDCKSDTNRPDTLNECASESAQIRSLEWPFLWWASTFLILGIQCMNTHEHLGEMFSFPLLWKARLFHLIFCRAYMFDIPQLLSIFWALSAILDWSCFFVCCCCTYDGWPVGGSVRYDALESRIHCRGRLMGHYAVKTHSYIRPIRRLNTAVHCSDSSFTSIHVM